MPWIAKKSQDATTAKIFAAVKCAFPGTPDDPESVVYRYNPYSIRVRIISSKFRGKTSAEREEIVNRAFKALSEQDIQDITLQLMLTPEEAKNPTLVHLEFDDPMDSYL